MKVLVIRLSSLGDVVLSAAALESEELSGAQVHWVVAREFAPLLEGHPRIHKVIPFDRGSGLKAWIALCRELWDTGFDQAIDLHLSLRSRICRLYFLYRGVGTRNRVLWSVVAKSRLRHWAYLIFKGLLPGFLRPRKRVEVFARAAGGTGDERPDLSHLKRLKPELPELNWKKTLCLMPASRWPGKEWPAGYFKEVVQLYEKRGFSFVVLGTRGDAASRDLADRLKRAKIPFENGIGRWKLDELGAVLARSRALLCVDTGLGHLAEAVGTPVRVIFGPTRPDLGFGPWMEDSVSVWKRVGCSPCGKDGRYCYRLGNRYACLKGLESSAVAENLPELSGGTGDDRPPEGGGAHG